MNKKYSKFLTIVLIVIAVLVVGLLIFFAVDAIRKYNLNSDANDGIGAFQNQYGNNTSSGNNLVIIGDGITNPYDNWTIDDDAFMNGIGNNGSEEGMNYKGFIMVGYIEIPRTNIKYPVLREVTKSSLETSVAILTGPGLNKPGNTVIAGHNFRNGTFFSDNAKLAIGDTIYITDTSGKTVTYTIYQKYQTTAEDGNFAVRDTKGAREITLSTCTDDSKNRIIIYAKAD